MKTYLIKHCPICKTDAEFTPKGLRCRQCAKDYYDQSYCKESGTLIQAHRITYHSYSCMKSRVLNPNEKNYKDYSKFKIYQPWIDSFETFLQDLGPRPSTKYTLDRIDPRGDYVPGNVRWNTRKGQARNKTNNVRVTYKGAEMLLCELADLCGVNQKLLRTRLFRYKWPMERAVQNKNFKIRPVNI